MADGNIGIKKTRGFLGEFKEFISKGNVIDLAVGVIIATAFGKITTSLVNDVIMPAIGYLFGGTDLSQLNIVLRPEVLNDAGEVASTAVVIGIGTFISTIIDFILVAFAVFFVIKAINSAKDKVESLVKKETEEDSETSPEPTEEQKLLTEIRDLLLEQNTRNK